jgi:Lon protease-like protein
MDDDLELRNFSGLTRLFPLPRVVLFPHAVLHLHIFEPRYRQMTEDALAGDQLLTVVRLRPTAPGVPVTPGEPSIHQVGCLGRVLQHERLADGRFNLLLLGRKRVRFKREVSTGKLYRVAEVEILEDRHDDQPEEPRRAELLALFRRAFEPRNPLDSDLTAILEGDLPLGVLTDIVAHALGLPPAVKQSLLDEPRVGHRTRALVALLEQTLRRTAQAADDVHRFPPNFSEN